MGVDVIERFHALYYDSQVWTQTFWLGVPTQKCPLDLWIYQEILAEKRPDLIIETGTAAGGSALYLASIGDQLGSGHVVTIDVEARDDRPRHPRITYLTGSSTDPEVLSAAAALRRPGGSVMVVLDSDHSAGHVLAELDWYAPLVTRGQYLIVEDTNVNGHPVLHNFGPGPMEAVEEFLHRTADFEIDLEREKLRMTFNPRGYLRRR